VRGAAGVHQAPHDAREHLIELPRVGHVSLRGGSHGREHDHAEDGLTFIKEFSRVNLWLNFSEMRRRPVSLDKPLTLKIANEPLSKLLDTVLLPLNMDWSVIEPGLVGVTAQPEDGPRMEPRVYGIKEPREAGHTVEGLMALITALDPGSWQATGGRGSMRSMAPGLLVIVQTRFVHDQIDKLFEKLMPAQR